MELAAGLLLPSLIVQWARTADSQNVTWILMNDFVYHYTHGTRFLPSPSSNR